MGKSTEPLKTRQYVTAETLTRREQDDAFGAPCKVLSINNIAIFRVTKIPTPKMA